MNIKTIILFITIITLSLGLLSCSSGRSKLINARESMLNATDDRGIANTRFENIIEYLENTDKQGLKKMFSPEALKEANDIDGGIDYIMEFYKGKTISMDDGGGPVSSDSKNNGEKTSELKSFCTVTTDEDTYIVFFIDQIVDTKNPDNVGIYMLQIIKESDYEKEFDWGGDKTKCAGIYRPDAVK